MMRGVYTIEAKRYGVYVLLVDTEPGGEWGETLRENVLTPSTAIRLGEALAAIGREILAEARPSRRLLLAASYNLYPNDAPKREP
mgnify:CR=1 FL=1